MPNYDERLKVVDHGDVLVVSLPVPAPPAGSPVDMTPVLERLGALELAVATLQGQVDVLQSQVASTQASMVALHMDATAWDVAHAYATGDVALGLDGLFYVAVGTPTTGLAPDLDPTAWDAVSVTDLATVPTP